MYAYTPTERVYVGQPRKIHQEAPPTDDRTCLNGLYSVFTVAAAVVSVVVVGFC
jgi:hypothetical protein